MTALVSLLFTTMIPIDCKIKFFPYIFLVKIVEFISATLKERMTTIITFAGATPID